MSDLVDLIFTEEEFERTVYEAKMEYYNAVETLSKELEQMEQCQFCRKH